MICAAFTAIQSSAQDLAKIPAVRAIFEEAAEISELIPVGRKLVFIGKDAALIYQALEILSTKDGLSPEAFKLSGRIFMAESAEQVPADIVRQDHVKIYSSLEAKNRGVRPDCSSSRMETQVWVLSINGGTEFDCEHEHFLENTDRPWNEVTADEIREFSADDNAVKFYALKRRVWRHLFLKTSTGVADEVIDMVVGLSQDPTLDSLKKLTNATMLRDFREFVRRHYSSLLGDLDRIYLKHCSQALAN